MKLIGSLTSPFVRTVRIVLAEKKSEYDFALDSPWTPETNVPNIIPLGKMPVLVLDDETVLFDSRAVSYTHLAGILGMFGKKFESLSSRVRCNRAKSLRQMVVDRQRPLATGLVLDGNEHTALGIEQVERRQVRNSRQFL